MSTNRRDFDVEQRGDLVARFTVRHQREDF